MRPGEDIHMSMVRLLDKLVGEIMQLIRSRSDVWARTLVIFASDNGGETWRKPHPNGNLAGGKFTNCERTCFYCYLS